MGGQMQGARLKADACSYSAAITASGKASHWSTALKLLKEAKECGGHVSNMIVVNATISACEKGGQWQIALHMLAEHGERDTISFNSVRSASSKRVEATVLCWTLFVPNLPLRVSFSKQSARGSTASLTTLVCWICMGSRSETWMLW